MINASSVVLTDTQTEFTSRNTHTLHALNNYIDIIHSVCKLEDLESSCSFIEEETQQLKFSVFTPPRASPVLIDALHRRITNIIVNGIDYPPALLFV